jgi:hypothetical protein
MRAQPRFGEFILQVAENPEDGRHVLAAYVSEISHHTFPERFLILDDMLSSISNSKIATHGNSGSFSESLLFVLSYYGLGGLCKLCQPTFKPCRLAKHVHREVSKCSKNQWQLRNLAFGLTLASFDLCRPL